MTTNNKQETSGTWNFLNPVLSFLYWTELERIVSIDLMLSWLKPLRLLTVSLPLPDHPELKDRLKDLLFFIIKDLYLWSFLHLYFLIFLVEWPLLCLHVSFIEFLLVLTEIINTRQWRKNSFIVFTLVILVIVSIGLHNKSIKIFYSNLLLHFVAQLMRHSPSRGVTSQLKWRRWYMEQKHFGVCWTLMVKNGAQQQRK